MFRSMVDELAVLKVQVPPHGAGIAGLGVTGSIDIGSAGMLGGKAQQQEEQQHQGGQGRVDNHDRSRLLEQEQAEMDRMEGEGGPSPTQRSYRWKNDRPMSFHNDAT